MKKFIKCIAVIMTCIMILPASFANAADYESDNDTSYNNNVDILISLKIIDDEYKNIYLSDTKIPIGVFKRILNRLNGIETDDIDTENISIRLALKSMIDSLNYSHLINEKEGTVSEYISVSQKIGLSDGAALSGNNLTSKQFVILLINYLDIRPLTSVSISKEGEKKYAEGKSYFEKNRISKGRGILESTSITSLTSKEGCRDNSVIIDGALFDIGGTDAYELLGYEVDFYAKTDDYGENELMYIKADKKNELIVVSADEIGNKTDLKTFYYTDGNKEKKADINGEFVQIYNKKLRLRKDKSFLIPKHGDVKLLDNNGDGSFDVIFITDYEVYTVATVDADNETIYAVNGAVIEAKGKYNLGIVKNGSDTDIKFIKTDDIIYAAYDESHKYVSINASNEAVGGVIEQVENGDKQYCVVDGARYRISENIAGDIKAGDEGVLYFGPDGIAQVYKPGKFCHYGLLVKVGKGNGIEDTFSARIFTDDGVLADYEFADKAYLYDSQNYKKLIKEDEIQLICNYLQKSLTAKEIPSNEHPGLGNAAPIIKYRIINNKIKTISLPTAFDSHKAGSKQDSYTLMSASEKADMHGAISYNYYMGHTRTYFPVPESWGGYSNDDSTKFLSDNTVVFQVPVDTLPGAAHYYKLSDKFEEDTVVYKGEHRNDRVTYANFYDLDDDRNIGVMVRYFDYSLSSNSGAVMVNKVTSKYIDGEEKTVIEAFGRGGTANEYILADDAKVDVNKKMNGFTKIAVKRSSALDLIRGDIVFLVYDNKGAVKSVEMVVPGGCPNEQLNMYHNTETYESFYELMLGKVSYKGRTLISLETDGGDVWHLNSYKNAPVFIYDSDKKTVTAADSNSIQLGDCIFVHREEAKISSIFIRR